MTTRVFAALSLCAVFFMPIAVGTAFSDTAQPKLQKLKTSTTTLRKKAGYWTECSYTAVGESCYTVYAGSSPVGSAHGTTQKLRPLKARDNVKFKKRAGYWLECSYSGLGENCYYVYASPHKPAKSKL